jgi:hypothetical protein
MRNFTEMIFSALQSINQVFEAGIAITAFSLFIRALTFNLRDRVSRSFAIQLACIMVVFSGEAISGSVTSLEGISFWLHFQWIGIVYFPAAFVHFSDALLETTGRPSRGRRSTLVRVFYILSTAFLVGMPYGLLVGPIVLDQGPVPHLSRTPITVVFTFFYILTSIFAGWSIWRAYKRTRLTQSQRRMLYLMAGALVLVIGTYPYLQISSEFALHHPTFFITLATFGNFLVFVFLILMAYAVAFFGIQWPDRLVKSRLVKWLLRGPVTVFIVLFLMTLARHSDVILGTVYTVSLPIVTVTSVLLIEHAITLGFPLIERWIFQGGDHQDLQLLQEVSDRLITSTDLREFLEAVLASVCDRFQVSTAFIAALSEEGIEHVVQVGHPELIQQEGLDEILLKRTSNNYTHNIFSWGDFWLVPLYSQQQEELLGLLGVQRKDGDKLEEGLSQALQMLGQRAALALEDRRLQRQVFQALETLNPKMNMIQQLRAATRYNQGGILNELDQRSISEEIARWVKDALSHYWGGPKLTESPLLRLHVVQEALNQHDGNPANAMRAILRQGIESVKPDGERKFTAEWILYNILEMKFMQGRKVREIALRLAMSEADLYRKQRVAIEEVAKALVDMEREVVEEVNGGSS